MNFCRIFNLFKITGNKRVKLQAPIFGKYDAFRRPLSLLGIRLEKNLKRDGIFFDIGFLNKG